MGEYLDLNMDLEAVFHYILRSSGPPRREAVCIYADALEEAGDSRLSWMLRQTDCPLGWTPDDLRGRSRTRMAMQRVRAGSFLMGSLVGEHPVCKNDEKQRLVTLSSDFALGVFPVTQAQFVTVTGTNPSRYASRPDQPVDRVTWRDAVTFCNTLSQSERLQPAYATEGREIALIPDADGYRLPTEAEWEYACRAGTNTLWPQGNDETQLDRYAWHQANAPRGTQPVGELLPNPWGFYDMLGNVSEWCDDPWRPVGKTYTKFVPTVRAYRGGSWALAAKHARPAYRCGSDVYLQSDMMGFRVARTYRESSKFSSPSSSLSSSSSFSSADPNVLCLANAAQVR